MTLYQANGEPYVPEPKAEAGPAPEPEPTPQPAQQRQYDDPFLDPDADEQRPSTNSARTGSIDNDQTQRYENLKAYTALYDQNLIVRFSALYDQNMLASAVCNKVHALIWREGWTLAPNPESEIDEATFEQLQKGFYDHLPLFSSLILEGLIGGSLIIEPMANPVNDQDVVLLPHKLSRLVRVKMRGIEPIELELTDQSTRPNDGYSLDVPVTPGDTGTGEKKDIIMYDEANGFVGDVFFFRFNHRLGDRLGKSILYHVERQLNGYQEVVDNIVARSVLMQMVSWAWKNFKEDKANKMKTEARKNSVLGLSRGKNQIVFPEDDEEIESITPDIRNLDLPNFVSKMLEVCLAWYNFSPSLFGQPTDQNRATLEESDRAFVDKYKMIQREYGAALSMLLDYLASQMMGRPIRNCCEIQFPSVIPQTLGQRINDKNTQLDLLARLFQQGLLTGDAYKAKVLIVMNGGEIELDEEDLEDEVERPEPAGEQEEET